MMRVRPKPRGPQEWPRQKKRGGTKRRAKGLAGEIPQRNNPPQPGGTTPKLPLSAAAIDVGDEIPKHPNSPVSQRGCKGATIQAEIRPHGPAPLHRRLARNGRVPALPGLWGQGRRVRRGAAAGLLKASEGSNSERRHGAAFVQSALRQGGTGQACRLKGYGHQARFSTVGGRPAGGRPFA